MASSLKWLTSEELDEILVTSRINNQNNNITGILIYSASTFLQVLEGKEEDVRSLYAKISEDSRSSGHVVLMKRSILEREFSEWYMGFKRLGSKKLAGFVELFEVNQATGAILNSNSGASLIVKSLVDEIA